jgi:hypothetical protein
MLPAKTFEMKRRLSKLGDTPACVVKDIFIIVPIVMISKRRGLISTYTTQTINMNE